MARYGAAALRAWDYADPVATTAFRIARPPQTNTATTTPAPAQEVSIFVRGGMLPRWFEMARDSLNALSALPVNWNSYTARLIGVDAVTNTVELLSAVMDDDGPLPTFVPVAHGGVLLEWHTMAADLEVTVLPNGRVRVVFERTGEDPLEPFEGLPQEVAADLKALVQNL